MINVFVTFWNHFSFSRIKDHKEDFWDVDALWLLRFFLLPLIILNFQWRYLLKIASFLQKSRTLEIIFYYDKKVIFHYNVSNCSFLFCRIRSNHELIIQILHKTQHHTIHTIEIETTIANTFNANVNLVL